MININEIKELVEFLANKHQTGASISPKDFNIATPSALDDITNYLYGLPQEYQPGMPMPRVAWEITQLVTDALSQLKPTVTLTVDSSGQATKPADYFHVSSINYFYYPAKETQDPDVPCEDDGTEQTTVLAKETVLPEVVMRPVGIVDDAKWSTLLSSAIRKPTKYYPICKFNDQEKILFAPTDLKTVQLVYLRYPVKPVWGYTAPDMVNPVYDPLTSVNVELPPSWKNLLCYMILTKVGINIREPQLQQFAELMKTKGV